MNKVTEMIRRGAAVCMSAAALGMVAQADTEPLDSFVPSLSAEANPLAVVLTADNLEALGDAAGSNVLMCLLDMEPDASDAALPQLTLSDSLTLTADAVECIDLSGLAGPDWKPDMEDVFSNAPDDESVLTQVSFPRIDTTASFDKSDVSYVVRRLTAFLFRTPKFVKVAFCLVVLAALAARRRRAPWGI
ncbi:MAG: hypothetical protein MSQ05_04235 [Akkermansia sp.]|nr:hypothetical protein [Akkermansia sp.]